VRNGSGYLITDHEQSNPELAQRAFPDLANAQAAAVSRAATYRAGKLNQQK